MIQRSVATAAALVVALTFVASCAPEGSTLDTSVPGVHQQGLTTSTVLAPVADSHVRRGNPYSAYGSEGLLRVGTSDRRKALVAFDTAAIKTALQNRQLISAHLELYLGAAAASMSAGQALVAQPLAKSFVEARATYSCADDTSPTNWANNCTTANLWSLEAAPFPWRSTGVAVPVATGTTGTLRFDVSGDLANVQAGTYAPYGWIVLRTLDTQNGEVNFRSREDPNGPRLVIITEALPPSAVCGNGVLESTEACDDGNAVDGDGCTACTVDVCGDGVVNNGDDCDDGNAVDGDGCTACIIDICGDGVMNNGDECDDGNAVDSDGCTACIIDVCGDGIVNSGDECDDGNAVASDGCTACVIDVCGDGVVNNGDECDDGNDVDGDGCTACIVDVCGDGVMNNGDECDDGNDVDGDGCTACVIDVCGDGVVNADDECDDGNDVDGDGCSACVIDTICGNGIVEGAEVCDDGNSVPWDGCTRCIAGPVCGDGIVGAPETCDDANTVSGDGCSACRVEVTTTLSNVADVAVSTTTYVADGSAPLIQLPSGDGALFRFDAAEIASSTARQRVVSAHLELTSTEGVFSSPRLVAQPLIRAFVEATATWNCADRPMSGPCTTANQWSLSPGTVDSSWFAWRGTGTAATAPSASRLHRLDVTIDLHENAAGRFAHHGWFVTSTGQFIQVHTRESPTIAERPRLVIVTAALSAVCGNGVFEVGEACDDGNVVDGDGCSACEIDVCGDFYVNDSGLEACDDGNDVDGDGCTACAIDFCGDGVVNNDGIEDCDDGNDVDDDGCTACRVDAADCGNGIVEPAEACDDGNTSNDDTCFNDCTKIERFSGASMYGSANAAGYAGWRSDGGLVALSTQGQLSMWTSADPNRWYGAYGGFGGTCGARLQNDRLLSAGNSTTILDTFTRATSVVQQPLRTGSLDRSCVRFDDGRILVTSSSATATGSEIFDPRTGRWSSTGAAPKGAAIRLPDGRFLFHEQGLTLLDPSTMTLTPVSAPARTQHAAVLLHDGRVLFVGGSVAGVAATAAVFDPATSTVSAAASPKVARRAPAAVVLRSGHVLLLGGAGFPQFHSLGDGEIYNPDLDVWTRKNAVSPREGHKLVLGADGRVFVIGGRLKDPFLGVRPDPGAAMLQPY